MNRLIDSHCHLDFEPLSEDIGGAIERAGRAGVVKMINIGTSLHRSRRSVEIAEFYPNVWASIGLHPQDAGELGEIDTAINTLRDLAKNKRVVAIGEIGLDYYSAGSGTKGSISAEGKEKQKSLFIAQLKLAEELKLPVIVHVRDAWDDFFSIIGNWKLEIGNYPVGVVHCFTGDEEIAEKLIKRGFYIGFTGFITFNQDKFEHIRKSAVAAPLDRILIETDAPFLAPEPHRGKVNEPAYVFEIAQRLADLRGVALEEVAETTTKNTEKLFGI